MKQTIVIGNLISVLSAYFMIKSSVSTGKKKIFTWQALQNLVLGTSNILLGSFSGVTTHLLSGIRNILVANNLFSKKLCIILLFATTSLGLYTNTRGLLGTIPVLATIFYTLGSYLFTKDNHIKLNLALNMTLWSIYDLSILNFVSFGIDIVIILIILRSVFAKNSQYYMGKEE